MPKNKVLVTGEKETFLVRVLLKKLEDAGIRKEFAMLDIDRIEEAWEDTSVITVYMDDGCRINDDIIHFLTEKASINEIKIILIGEKKDVQVLNEDIPDSLILKKMIRPIDNDEYVGTVSELFKQMRSGAHQKSILVIDDDPSFLKLIREWLKDSYKVSVVNSGLSAIKWLSKNKADLILLDYEMPVMSGPKVLEMLRSENELKKIPVIFLTGKDDRKSVMDVLSLKPEGYFLKSTDRAVLLSKLKEFFILRL